MLHWMATTLISIHRGHGLENFNFEEVRSFTNLVTIINEENRWSEEVQYCIQAGHCHTTSTKDS